MNVHRARRLIAAVLTTVTILSVGLIARGTAAQAVVPTLPNPNSHGITLVNLSEVPASGRWQGTMLAAEISSTAIFQNIFVRIYLPAGYNPALRYPSLYLLHGSLDVAQGDDAAGWQERTNGPGFIDASAYRGITVMPEAGKAGWYTNWVGADRGGRSPQWETFHISQLIPWIDANFPTQADKAHRSIAGVSMGGFGALSYAMRHPGLFSAVASFSGPNDIQDEITRQGVIANEVTILGGTAITAAQASDNLYHTPDVTNVFGPYAFGQNSPAWSDDNPIEHLGVYHDAAMKMALYVGDGSGPHTEDGSEVIEGLLKTANDKVFPLLVQAGAVPRYCTGVGVHEWPFWGPDLQDFASYIAGQTPATCPNSWGAPVPPS
jgi:S-formylglutathione hydrolase FrmB